MSTIVEKVNTSVFYSGYKKSHLPGSKAFEIPTWIEGEWYCGDIKVDEGILYNTVQGPFSSYKDAAKIVTKQIQNDPERYDKLNMFICVYRNNK